MIRRTLLERPAYVYPAEEWRMVERQFYPRLLAENETLFSTSNGYLGLRGSNEEGAPVFHAGTFVNGFYESWPILYGEEAYGFAKTGQTIVNVPDAKIIRLYVDDEPLFLPTANLVHFERALDMRAGTLDREIVWETQAGRRVSIKSRRMVSLQHRHLAAMSYEVTVLDARAPVTISSKLVNEHPERGNHGDPRRPQGFAEAVLEIQSIEVKGNRLLFGYRTKSSGMTLGCGIDHEIDTECPHTCEVRPGEDSGKVVISVDAKPGVPIRITKYAAYHTSRSAPPAELCERSERTLNRAVSHGFAHLLRSQHDYLDEFWSRCDVRVVGDTAVQQVIRFNLFHVLQSTARAEGVGIPAKGLTGDGYEGHYFWDTEIYLLPFLTYTSPRIARNLLKFRYSLLDMARARAAQVNQRGAQFPWRTINGEEASAYYAAGTAQYHINADIMYALKKYVEVTGDVEFLEETGAELLVETSRLWCDLGFYSIRRGGRFCIQGVTGPDEYNTVVDNNAFTNLMARENLWYAARAVEEMRERSPQKFQALVDRTKLQPEEVAEWRCAADHMYVPYDEKEGIHPQDDSFMDRKPWDFEHTPPDRYPLLLHHHPLVIYRHRVIKQADVVLAMFLLGHEFTREEKRRNFDYYDPMTTGDSSLSACIQAIMAAELGYGERAVEYARYAALMDLGDVNRNVKDGCHIASMGGTWMAVVYGMAGLRDSDGRTRFIPQPPLPPIQGLRFALRIRGRVLEIELDRRSVRYTLLEGDELDFFFRDEPIRVSRKDPTAERGLGEPVDAEVR